MFYNILAVKPLILVSKPISVSGGTCKLNVGD